MLKVSSDDLLAFTFGIPCDYISVGAANRLMTRGNSQYYY